MTYKTYTPKSENTKTGGYHSLVVYWISVTIYDLNQVFCKTYKSYMTYKTYEQMNGAARSGKQNIVEGSLENSTESNLKLTGVARASFGELAEDYLDILRDQSLPVWDKDDPRVMEIRKNRDFPNHSYKSYTTYMTYTQNLESFCNLMISLCYKEMYLLSRLLVGIENKFVKDGGFRENLFQKRVEYRQKLALSK
jgi:four helix bundle suffix protein